MAHDAKTQVSTLGLAPDLARGLAELSAAGHELRELIRGITPAQASWRPGHERWSIVECVDHLAVTAEGYVDRMSAPIQQARTRGLLGSREPRYSWWTAMFLKMLEPPPRRRFPAPPAFRPAPAATLDLERSCKRLEAARQKLEALVVQANGLDLARVKIPSPATALIKFPLGRAFQIIAAHERRHIWQARQVTHAPGYPSV